MKFQIEIPIRKGLVKGMKNGVIILHKGEGLSSQAAVNRVKRILGVKKAGHTGTLDPLATGVLPILVERGVKASEFMLTGDKHYSATLLLGITTDTEDITGSVLSRSDIVPSEEAVRAAVKSFVGEYMQTPPMYSALKVGGKKLCDLARAGVEIERQAREVKIFSADTKRLSEREYRLDIHCSKGTYIRTLCADIGKKLHTGGVMKTLCRTEASGFKLEEAHTIEQLESMSREELEAAVLPVEYIFADRKKLTLSEFYSRLAKNGVEIYLKKLGIDTLSVGEEVRMYDSTGEFFALGAVRSFDEGLAVKPIRQF